MGRGKGTVESAGTAEGTGVADGTSAGRGSTVDIEGVGAVRREAWLEVRWQQRA